MCTCIGRAIKFGLILLWLKTYNIHLHYSHSMKIVYTLMYCWDFVLETENPPADDMYEGVEPADDNLTTGEGSVDGAPNRERTVTVNMENLMKDTKPENIEGVILQGKSRNLCTVDIYPIVRLILHCILVLTCSVNIQCKPFIKKIMLHDHQCC